MRRILFEPPTPEAFLAALRPLRQADAAAWLIGDNALAAAVEAAALDLDLPLRREPPPPDAPGCPLLVFTETSGAALQTELLRFAGMPEAAILAPVTDWHFSQRPLFLISIPKAGTHLVFELARAFGYHTGGEPPEFPQGQTWYHLEYHNAHTAAADFFVDTVRRAPFGNRHHRFMSAPAIFVYRHPLDILVSEAHYDHLDGKTPFAGWFDGLDFEARAARLLNGNFLLGSLRERVGKYLPWLDFPNVISVSFEELVGAQGGGDGTEQLDLIWSMQLKLQIPGEPAEIAAKIFNTGAATFRAGQIGAYQRELPPAWINQFQTRNEDLLGALGYAAEAAMLPETRMRHRHRPLATSAQDFDSVPITLENFYLGCNLVRYRQRIYAVPVAAGAVALEALPAEHLTALPSSPALSELKALLLIGPEELARRQHAFSQLGAMLQGTAAPDRTYAYWTDVATPSLIESYKDFNIVFFERRFYGIRQSLGKVDLTGDLRALLDAIPIDEFFVATSVAQLREQIDGFSTSHRLWREINALRDGEAGLAKRLAEQRAEFSAGLERTHTEAQMLLAEAQETARAARDETLHALRDGLDQSAAASAASRQRLAQLEAGLGELGAALAREAGAGEGARAQIADLERALAELAAAQARAIAVAADAVARQQTELLDALRGDLTARFDAAFAAMRAQLEGLNAESQEQRALIAEMQLGWRRRLRRWLRRRA